MNQVESFMLVLAALLQVVYLRGRGIDWLRCLAAALLTLPASYFCITGSTQLLTCDDSTMIHDFISLSENEALHWDLYGMLRTSTAFTGSLVTIAAKVSGLTKDLSVILAKGVHCLGGILLLLLLVDQTFRWYAGRGSLLSHYLVTFTGVALLPVFVLSLHTINYDMISIAFGTLALVWLGAGWRRQDKRLLIACLAAAALAAQEKLVAAPILWICSFVAALLLIRMGGPAAIKRSLRAVATALCVPLAVFAISFMLVWLVTLGNKPTSGLLDAMFRPFLYGVFPLLNLVLEERFSVLLLTVRPDPMLSITMFSGFVAVFSLAVLISNRMIDVVCRSAAFEPIMEKSARLFPFVKFLSLAGIIGAGVAATYLLHATAYPLVPVPEGHYEPVQAWNNVSLAFGAPSAFLHYLASIAWACATFVNTIPSAILLAVLGVWGAEAFRRFRFPSLGRPSITLHDLVAFLALLTMPLYGLMKFRLNLRYMGLFMLVFVLMGLVGVAEQRFRIRWLKPVLIGGFLAALFVEVAPFGPTFVTFRPLWSNPPREFCETPAYGSIPPWHTGWGEELMMAGKELCRRDPSCATATGLTLFHNYPGTWINHPAGISTIHMEDGFDAYGYGSGDFYLFSRTGATFCNIPFPEGVSPLFTIQDRGVIRAWFFRGSDIRAAGIRFPARREGAARGRPEDRASLIREPFSQPAAP